MITPNPTYTCQVCNRTLQCRRRAAHEKTQYHLKRVPKPIPGIFPPAECPVCLDTIGQVPSACVQCHQQWCGDCDANIAKCPFCRLVVSGREEQSKAHDAQLIDWYSSSEAFVPDANPTHPVLTGSLRQRLIRNLRVLFFDEPELDIVTVLADWLDNST